MYPKGTEIELISMEDSYAVPSGTHGVVDFVDDIGTIQMIWDNGSTLGLVVGKDNFKVIKKLSIDSTSKNAEQLENKPEAPIIGADSNVFNLIGICSLALNKAGYNDKAKEMTNRITNSKSYDEALSIKEEYITPVDAYDIRI